MNTDHVKAFERTRQITDRWIADVQHALHWPQRQRAYLALRAVLQALRDCLIVDEAADLGAQLPMLLRGMYYEGWVPAKVPVRMNLEDFLERIREHFRDEPDLDAEGVAEAVLSVLARHVTPGELRDVKHALGAKLQELWPPTVS